MIFRYILLAACLAVTVHLRAQPASPATNSPAWRWDQLQQLVQKTHEKIEFGKNTEAEFANELRQFDELIAAAKDSKTDEAAQVRYIKATLYLQIFRDFKKCQEMMQGIADDYPRTIYGRNASNLVAKIHTMLSQTNSAGNVISQQTAAFPIGQAPADFEEKDLSGKPISLAACKGKVVLLDFWATWCGPCVMEIPNVISVYQKYHDQGFEVIGVTLDNDRDELDDFLKKNPALVWPQFFDAGGQNKLAEKYGIHAIPFAVLIGRDGKVVATNLRGSSLEPAVAAALENK